MRMFIAVSVLFLSCLEGCPVELETLMKKLTFINLWHVEDIGMLVLVIVISMTEDQEMTIFMDNYPEIYKDRGGSND